MFNWTCSLAGVWGSWLVFEGTCSLAGVSLSWRDRSDPES